MEVINLPEKRFALLVYIVSSFMKIDDALRVVTRALSLTEIPLADILDESLSSNEMDAIREFNESFDDLVKQKIAVRKAIDLIEDKRLLLDFREYVSDYGVDGIFDLNSFETFYLIRKLAKLI